MSLRNLWVFFALLGAGCASVVMPSVSEDLRRKASVVELPEFMKEYAASGFYLKQRLDPATRGWILGSMSGRRDGWSEGVNLVAIDYAYRGYDYRRFDDEVQALLFKAMGVYCAERGGQVLSDGKIPLANRDFIVHPGNGRLCSGKDGKLLGAIVYGQVTRDALAVQSTKVGTAAWRSLEYNVLSSTQIADLRTVSGVVRKETMDKYQQQADEARQRNAALVANRRKMDSIGTSMNQGAFNSWRQSLKEGEACWVGPRKTSQKLMLHAMVIERKGSIVRVQYDGKTNAGYLIKLPSSEEWVNLKDTYPHNEFDVLTGDSIVTPRVQPQ